MIKTIVSIAGLIAVFSNTSVAQPLDRIETGNSCSFFGETIPENVATFASDNEAEQAISRIVTASGLVPRFDTRAAAVPNAMAIIQGNTRTILYSQFFMQQMRRATGNNEWGPISILAHEIGHHLNAHTLDGRGSRPNTELEADYFSGFVLQRMGASIEDARVAIGTMNDERGSLTHPGKNDRLAAITNGWSKACEIDQGCTQALTTNTNPNEAIVSYRYFVIGESGDRTADNDFGMNCSNNTEEHRVEVALNHYVGCRTRMSQRSNSCEIQAFFDGPNHDERNLTGSFNPSISTMSRHPNGLTTVVCTIEE